MNATLVYTSSAAQDNAERVARVAAAGRVKRARLAAEYRAIIRQARAESVAAQWVADVIAEGAVTVGFKICDDWGKHRFSVPVADAADVVARHYGEDMEAWGIRADGSYCPSGW